MTDNTGPNSTRPPSTRPTSTGPNPSEPNASGPNRPKRGAIPAPRSLLAAARPYQRTVGAPPNVLVHPQKLSMWGNDVHGDCVTAEEAFAKACNNPEFFITDAEVIAWATSHNVLEGANLPEVMTWMQSGGFTQDASLYDDGPYYSVDWTNAGVLQAAIAQGPVKLGIAADQIDGAYSRTGGRTGWFATGFHNDAGEDHCVSLCGYGTIAWLAAGLGVPVPSGIDGTRPGYAMYTWDSIGIIDVPSMVAITHEAWLRNPTTIAKSLGPQWRANDLTDAAAAPIAAGDPFGYTWSVDSTEHVVFRGADGHIHELWFNGGWHQNDLSVAASAPPAAGEPYGYTWSADSTQHVVFRGADEHVHELWFNGGWNHNDLTAATGCPAASAGVVGYTFSADTTEHVVFRGADAHIHELWFNGSWNHNDLTAATGSPAAAYGTPTGYTWSADNTEHVVYRGVDAHIHELWFNGTWHHNDLTAASGGSPLAASDPAGYTWDVDTTEHVVYHGVNGAIVELWFNGAWQINDLTSAAGNPGVPAGKPAGYAYAADKTEHVVYRRVDGHVIELYL